MNFLEYQVFYSYRVPLGEDGKPCGPPQLTRNGFVKPIHGTEKAPKKVHAIKNVVALQSKDIEL